MAGVSRLCLKMVTETAAVSTMPKPAQIAYAIPKGMVFKACDKKKKHKVKAIMVMIEGINFVNPSDAFKKLDPVTSNVMASARYRYFIPQLFYDTKVLPVKYFFFDVGQNILSFSDSAQGLLSNSKIGSNVAQLYPLRQIWINCDQCMITFLCRFNMQGGNPFF